MAHPFGFLKGGDFGSLSLFAVRCWVLFSLPNAEQFQPSQRFRNPILGEHSKPPVLSYSSRTVLPLCSFSVRSPGFSFFACVLA